MVNKCTHELVDMQALLLRILNPMKLCSEQVGWNIEFNTNTRTVTTVSPPKDLVVRCCAEASQTNAGLLPLLPRDTMATAPS
jgi:hypothetical protein